MWFWQSDNISISRVIDIDYVPLSAEDIYPNTTAPALRQAHSHLGREFINPATLELRLSLHVFVPRTPLHTMLVDTCVGNDKQRPKPDRLGQTLWRFHRESGGSRRASQRGRLRPLHTSRRRSRWLNTRLVDSRWVPTFSNAQYLIAAPEYDCWRSKYAERPQISLNYGFFEFTMSRRATDTASPAVTYCTIRRSSHLIGHKILPRPWRV
jgi:hypothetical protein